MPLIPIGTEIQPRHAPIANWALIAANAGVHFFAAPLGAALGFELHTAWALDAARPALHQYLTYQFVHGDIWHLLGNMLFLWIFGNAVCDRMGTIAYLMFYLAGGVFAGIAFTQGAENPMVGASGAIAAVTTAFLALFPRVHVTMLVWMFFIFTFQVPAMIVIVFKIILWDNILAPQIDPDVAASSVAFSAHLGGYGFGLVVATVLLALGALPRNQFDMVALWERWRRRSGFTVRGGPVPAARPIQVEELGSRPLEAVPLTPVEKLREEIGEALARRDLEAAAEAYLRLQTLDRGQVMSRPNQLELANYLAQTRRYRAAAEAYEAFLIAYPGSADAPQVLLFLGLLCSRYLHDPARARAHLQRAHDTLTSDAQRKLAGDELQRLGQPAAEPDPPPAAAD